MKPQYSFSRFVFKKKISSNKQNGENSDIILNVVECFLQHQLSSIRWLKSIFNNVSFRSYQHCPIPLFKLFKYMLGNIYCRCNKSSLYIIVEDKFTIIYKLKPWSATGMISFVEFSSIKLMKFLYNFCLLQSNANKWSLRSTHISISQRSTF